MTRTLLALTCLAAAGAAAPAIATAATALPPVEVTAPAALPDRALQDLSGLYRLSDGRMLRVHQGGTGLFAAIGRKRAMPLDTVGGHRFATRDGRTTIEFRPAPDGRVDTLRLTQWVAQAAAKSAPGAE